MLHPAVILYFDGFAGDRHIPSEALAARFPDDVDNHHGIAKAVDVPSILKLQSAEEDELLNYLRCDDGSVVQLAMAALEGMWLGECGEHPQERMEAAIKATQDGDLPTAREIVEQVVGDFPQYSYGWAKLGTIEYRAGNTKLCYLALTILVLQLTGVKRTCWRQEMLKRLWGTTRLRSKRSLI